MVTKKDLEDLYKLSDNTVYKTLKACGLETSKTNYSNEEIESRFVPARAILDGGGNYKDVETFFRLKDSKASSNGHSSNASSEGLGQPETNSVQAEGFMEVVQEEVSDSINEMVKAAVTEIVPYIPRMTAAALLEAASSGKIREAFSKFRQGFVSGRNPYGASGMSGFGSVIEVPIAGLGGFTEVPESSNFPEFVPDPASDSDGDEVSDATA
jgi:hypothetical protein